MILMTTQSPQSKLKVFIYGFHTIYSVYMYDFMDKLYCCININDITGFMQLVHDASLRRRGVREKTKI